MEAPQLASTRAPSSLLLFFHISLLHAWLHGEDGGSMPAFVAHATDRFAFADAFPVPVLGSLREIFGNLTNTCEVLVEVKSSSVNPTDRHTDGYRLPKVLGADVAGIVVEVEDNCTRLKVGDRVWGDIGANAYFPNGTKTKELGAYARYAVALETQLGLMPSNIGFPEGGSLPKVALTSYKALVWYGKANTWDKKETAVLLLGGSGGTGSAGLQMASAFGATSLITTTSKKNFEYCQELGATRVIDYKSDNWWEVLEDESLDVIYDTVGQHGTADRAMKKLRSGGHFVTIAGMLSKNPRYVREEKIVETNSVTFYPGRMLRRIFSLTATRTSAT